MSELLIALGANLPGSHGDLRATLARALVLLEAKPRIRVVKRSRWYRTPAYPAGSGPDFVNGAAVLASDLEPERILAYLHEVEAELGRERPVRWAPRVCDLDLIAAGDRILPDVEEVSRWMRLDPDEAAGRAPDRLILPHPRLHSRAFVLVPINDIAPDWVHPVLQLPVSALLSRLPPEEIAEITLLE